MKKIIALSLLLLSLNLFAQDNTPVKMFSAFKVGALAGVNFSTLSGGSVLLEGKINLTPELYFTLSAGYSKINKKAAYTVNTYYHMQFDNINAYLPESYNVHEINYDAFPVSLGLEYYFLHNIFSPYTLLEFGYNGVDFHQVTSWASTGLPGSYSTYDQLPAVYKSKDPLFFIKNSYRIAIGAGTTYKLTRFVSLDLRYVYQFNNSLENTNQILVGIVY